MFVKLEGARRNDDSVTIEEVWYDDTLESTDGTGSNSLLSKFYPWMTF